MRSFAPPAIRLRRMAGCLVALFAAVGYHASGRAFYAGFLTAQGSGMDFLLAEELAYIALFTTFATVAVAALVWATWDSTLVGHLLSIFRRMALHAGPACVLAAVVVAAVAAAAARSVLGYAVVSDDEHAYRFIAQTLGTGALTAPSPGRDYWFYFDQFVVANDHGRYGKYPIGHPLLLAAGRALGLELLVVPVVTGLAILPVGWIALRLFGRETALLSALLFVLSPQIALTGATALSQPACALALAAGVACLLKAEDGEQESWRWLAAAGVALGFGVLVRPLPGALFAAVAVVHRLRRHRWMTGDRRGWAALLTPLALFAGILLLVNRAQTGDAFTSGYHVYHRADRGLAGTADLLSGNLAVIAMSPASALLRLSVWLFGCPFVWLLPAWARRSRASALLWSMVAAEIVYRLLSAKAGVGAVGPIYMYEVVPLLCLLAADGALRLAASTVPGPDRARRLVAATLLAAAAVNVTMFLPVKVRELRRMADAQLALPRLLESRGVHHALVFARFAVPPERKRSWAYFARANSPALDDDVLIVRPHPDPERNREFWRRRHPDRTVWSFDYPETGPVLVPIEDTGPWPGQR